MRKILLLFLFFQITGIGAGAQDKDLKLILVSEQNPQDTSWQYKIRIDFISQKSKPVWFIYNPEFSVHCCRSTYENVGVETEKLDSGQYKLFEHCADCDPICCEFPKRIGKTLHPHDTISYRDNLFFSQRQVHTADNKIVRVFTGHYRCRAWRIYRENGKEYKIWSDWLYIDFPK